MSKTIAKSLLWGSTKLKTYNIVNTIREAGLILDLSLASNHLLMSKDTVLTNAQLSKYEKLIKLRCEHTPFAYLTNQVMFCDLPIYVNKNVLIPRPETEELVELVSDHIASIENHENLKIIEVGSGSGAISIVLASIFPNIKIIASDISDQALSIAQKNINSNNKTPQISLFKSDLLKSIPGPIDILIANLPYIPSGELKNLTTDITSHEPLLALDGGSDGLQIIKELLIQAKPKLSVHGTIFLEIWHTHAKPLQNLTRKLFPKATLTIKNDLSSLPRFAILRL